MKCWEYVGLNDTSYNPYGYWQSIQYTIIEKKGRGKNKLFKVQAKHGYIKREWVSWKDLKQLKRTIKRLDSITEIGMKYLEGK